MKCLTEIKELFQTKPIYKELKEVRKEIAKTNDEHKKNELELYEDRIRKFSVSVLERVKNNEENSFENLMMIKDMRNFLHYYAYQIRKFHKFRYKKQNVLHEIRFQIFYHVSNNYRIYNEPHEISLLIMSMRGWIKQKVSEELSNAYKPKEDEQINNAFLECTEFDDTKVFVYDLINRYLDDEEREVFELKFFEGRGFVEVGKIMGFSKDTAQRRYKRSLNKIKKVIELD